MGFIWWFAFVKSAMLGLTWDKCDLHSLGAWFRGWVRFGRGVAVTSKGGRMRCFWFRVTPGFVMEA